MAPATPSMAKGGSNSKQSSSQILSDTKSAKVTALTSNGVSCSIKVDDVDVEIFQSSQSGKANSGFIIATSGKRYKIAVANNGTAFTSERFYATILIDGEVQDCYLFQHTVAAFSGKYTGPSSICPWIFAPLRTTDDDALATSDPKFIAGVGSICVELRRVTVRSLSQVHYFKGEAAKDAQVIDERLKKGNISNQTTLGDPITVTVSSSSNAVDRYIDSPHEMPFLSFTFLYRSSATLEMLGVIRSSPLPDEVDDDVSISAEPSSKRKKTIVVVSDSDDEVQIIKKIKPDPAVKDTRGVK